MLLLNEIEIKPTIFPDKTSQVWKLDEHFVKRNNVITWKFENESEFLHLAQLVDLLRVYYNVSYSLDLPYLPYARQDKDITNESTFALDTFAGLLNTLNFSEVKIIDVHSEKALELIDNSKNVHPKKEIDFALDKSKATAIAFPDQGACNRYCDLEYGLGGYETIIGHKERDELTGYIKKYNIIGNPKNKNILIVDDLCDGGMTFRILAKKLLADGADQVDLYVSHGIFSKGKQVLYDDGITNIYIAGENE